MKKEKKRGKNGSLPAQRRRREKTTTRIGKKIKLPRGVKSAWKMRKKKPTLRRRVSLRKEESRGGKRVRPLGEEEYRKKTEKRRRENSRRQGGKKRPERIVMRFFFAKERDATAEEFHLKSIKKPRRGTRVVEWQTWGGRNFSGTLPR